jgi:hypothetical protein
LQVVLQNLRRHDRYLYVLPQSAKFEETRK